MHNFDAARFPWVSTEIVVGWDSLNTLPDLLRSRGIGKRVLIMSGRHAIRKLGYDQLLQRLLKGRALTWHANIPPNPTFEDCDEALVQLRRTKPDAVIAIGGGSVLDVAKVAHALAGVKTGAARELVAKIPVAARPRSRLIAIPTTAGTGSEVTPFAAIWDYGLQKKFSVDHSRLLPDLAIVDPKISSHMDARLTALTGADAFSHALESLWSKRATPVSKAIAAEALERIRKTLPEIIRGESGKNDRTRFLRTEMAWASLMAGMAIGLTRTALSHAISYPLTIRYHVPHGQAVGVTLPAVFRLVAPAMKEDAARIAAALGASKTSQVPLLLKKWLKSIGLAASLQDLDIPLEDLPVIAAQSTSPGRSDNLRVKAGPADVSRVLRASWPS